MARPKPPRAATTTAPRRRRARPPSGPSAAKAKAPKAARDRRKLPRRPFRGMERWDAPDHRDAVRRALLAHLKAALAARAVHRQRFGLLAALDALGSALADPGLPAAHYIGDATPDDLAEAAAQFRRRLAGDRNSEVGLGLRVSSDWALRVWHLVAARVAPDEVAASVYREATGGALANGTEAARKNRKRAGNARNVIKRTYAAMAVPPDATRDRDVSAAVAGVLDDIADGLASMLLESVASEIGGQTAPVVVR